MSGIESAAPGEPSTGDSPGMHVQVITSRLGWDGVDLREVWRYRELVWLLVRRDFVAEYKQTLLGPIWFVLHPLVNATVFSVIFGYVAKLPTDGVPHFLFYLTGVTVWNYLSACVAGTGPTFLNNAPLFGKVYFPRLVAPLAAVISRLYVSAIQYGLLLALVAWYVSRGASVQPGWLILATPMLFLHTALLGTAVGLVVASLSTRYRDLLMASSFLLTIWMYATPIVYPLSQVPERWRWLFIAFNPMSAVVEAFRMAQLGVGILSLSQYAISLVTTVIALAISLVVFNRVSKVFVDTV